MAEQNDSGPTVESVFEDFLQERLASKDSERGYRDDWGRFVEWCKAQHVDVLTAKPRDVSRYMRSLEDKAKSTRARALSVVRSVYGALVVAELREANPAREVKNQKAGGVTRTPYLEESELAAILSFYGSSWRDRRDRLCVQLLAGIGWRRAEIARMKCEDFKDGKIRGVVKGGKEALATVAPWLLDEIEEWKDHVGMRQGPLLYRAEHDHHPVTGAIVYNIVRRVGAEVGIPPASAVPHALRRTLATLSDRHGVPIADIQHALAHSKLATTEGYIKGLRVVKHAPSEWMAKLVERSRSRNDAPKPE